MQPWFIYSIGGTTSCSYHIIFFFGTEHIPLSSQRPFHFHRSYWRHFCSDQAYKILSLCAWHTSGTLLDKYCNYWGISPGSLSRQTRCCSLGNPSTRNKMAWGATKTSFKDCTGLLYLILVLWLVLFVIGGLMKKSQLIHRNGFSSRHPLGTK